MPPRRGGQVVVNLVINISPVEIKRYKILQPNPTFLFTIYFSSLHSLQQLGLYIIPVAFSQQRLKNFAYPEKNVKFKLLANFILSLWPNLSILLYYNIQFSSGVQSTTAKKLCLQNLQKFLKIIFNIILQKQMTKILNMF